MHANCKALLGCMESLLGGVTASVANDKDMVAEEVYCMADEHDVLVPIHELQERNINMSQLGCSQCLVGVIGTPNADEKGTWRMHHEF